MCWEENTRSIKQGNKNERIGGKKPTHTLESENSITREEEPENNSEGYKVQKFKMINLCAQALDSVKVGLARSEWSVLGLYEMIHIKESLVSKNKYPNQANKGWLNSLSMVSLALFLQSDVSDSEVSCTDVAPRVEGYQRSCDHLGSHKDPCAKEYWESCSPLQSSYTTVCLVLCSKQLKRLFHLVKSEPLPWTMHFSFFPHSLHSK